MEKVLRDLENPELRKQLELEAKAAEIEDRLEEKKRRKRSGVDKRRQELLRQRW